MTDPLDRVTSAVASLADLRSHATPSVWIFRGHRRACWELETSLERCCARHKVESRDRGLIETELFREFRRAYHQYSEHVPKVSSSVEWLALMQHHGAPTRLLDFSYSVEVAAYFATERSSNDCAVWALNTEWAIKVAPERLRAAKKQEDQIKQLDVAFLEDSEAVFKPLFMDEPFALAVVPVNPFRLNERLRVQKGVFLAPCSVEHSFVDNLRAMPGWDDPKNVKRLIIRANHVAAIRRELFDANVSRRSLFPGLDGYAEALGIYHPVYDQDHPHRKRLEKLHTTLKRGAP